MTAVESVRPARARQEFWAGAAGEWTDSSGCKSLGEGEVALAAVVRAGSSHAGWGTLQVQSGPQRAVVGRRTKRSGPQGEKEGCELEGEGSGVGH